MHTVATCTWWTRVRRGGGNWNAVVVTDLASREAETRGSFSELEFLETFDGDEELIDRHFITVQI